jgi:hypothetical protein
LVPGTKKLGHLGWAVKQGGLELWTLEDTDQGAVSNFRSRVSGNDAFLFRKNILFEMN